MNKRLALIFITAFLVFDAQRATAYDFKV